MPRSIVFAAALAMASVAAGAHARDHSIHVVLQGLDLDKPADAQKAYDRLSQAVRQACNTEHEVFVSDEAERFDICYRNTLADAVAQSKAPLLAALNGQPAPNIQLAHR